MEKIISYIASFLVILLVLPVHEFAHAFAAVKAGDPTPKLQGRYTINPVKHFDLIGLIMLMVVRFGWAKPVPVNPFNFKNLRRDYFFVSVAGILANLIMAFLFAFLFVLYCFIMQSVSVDWLAQAGYYPVAVEFMYYGMPAVLETSLNAGVLSIVNYAIYNLIYYVLIYGVIINLNLFIFNLIPVYPLDGFRILDCLLKKKGKVFSFLQRYGYFMLLGLFIWGFLCDYVADVMPIFEYLDILGLFLSGVNQIFFNLFTGFWGLFF